MIKQNYFECVLKIISGHNSFTYSLGIESLCYKLKKNGILFLGNISQLFVATRLTRRAAQTFKWCISVIVAII